MRDDPPSGRVAVSIVGHHDFARSIRAIKAIQDVCDVALGVAKQIIDTALAGQPATFDTPSEESAETLAEELASLGWIVSVRGAIHDLGLPEPPDWYKRLKGHASVVRSVASSETTLRLVVQARQCELTLGDELVIVMQENFPVGASIDALQRLDAGVQVDLQLDDAESVELLLCLFTPGTDLEVLSSMGA